MRRAARGVVLALAVAAHSAGLGLLLAFMVVSA